MATLWQKAMYFLGLEDELEQETGEMITAEMAQPVSTPTGGRRVDPPSPRLRPNLDAGVQSDSAAVRSVPGGSTTAEVVVAIDFADAQILADHLRARRPVALDLREADTDTVRRLVDFASGITYALDGTMQKIAHGVILVSPARVNLSLDERERLVGLGLYELSS